MTAEPTWVRGALSRARFGPYLLKAGGDVDAALRLYWWNVDVSAAFYPSLHLLEVALRNALHARLSIMLQRTDWWKVAVRGNGMRLVEDAIAKVRDRKPLSSADDIVAELTFGFWASLISRRYDRTLSVPGLHQAFPHYRGRRNQLHNILWAMVLFRNRIMHHEPIHHRHLVADHATVRKLLGYLSPELVACVEPYDRVPAALRRRAAIFDSAGRRP